jgi:hypothetical protein
LSITKSYISALIICDVILQENGCQMGNVQLREATLETTGVYLCEVSTESPNFETDVRLANLTVRGEQMLPFFYFALWATSFSREIKKTADWERRRSKFYETEGIRCFISAPFFGSRPRSLARVYLLREARPTKSFFM